MANTFNASVIIPAYNCADTIAEQLEALQNQHYEGNFEVIVADNNCTDDTISVVNQFAGKLNNLKVIQAYKKKGAGYARNRGVEEAESEFILFCDADDKVSEHWVAQMVKALKKHEIVAPKMEHYKISQPRYAHIRKRMQAEGLLTSKYEPSWPFAGASGLGVRKELHQRINGFDETFSAGEDLDYCWRAQLDGNAELVYNPEALIHIRHRGKPLQFIRQAIYWGTYDAYIENKYKKYGIKLKRQNGTLRNYKKKIVNLNMINDQVWRDHFTWRIFSDIGKLKGYLKLIFSRW